jgi:precorrin-6B C5,15-methyltransferase / cobalt-precorrin-6B C5,C15-methyltransferase
MTTPWLTVIGIGEDGRDGLSAKALAAIDRAAHLVGSERQLALIGTMDGDIHRWPSPIDGMFDRIAAWRGSPTVILASGDPMMFGIGKTLLARFAADEIVVLPQLSAFSLAAAHLKWPLQHVDTVSLHGRPACLVEPLIAPGNRILALTSGRSTIAEVAKRLVRRGFAQSRLTVLEHMNGTAERLTSFAAADAEDAPHVSDFHTLAIECRAGADAVILPPIPGLPDEAFRHDGQLTKREVRCITIAALAPSPDRLLWDVGSGSGSVAIEWMRAARNGRAIAFEREAGRLAMIAANAEELGVPDLAIVPGTVPASLADQPAPDAVFIGGGLSDEAVFSSIWPRLAPAGMLVANTVTLEGEARLIALHGQHGGDLVRIDVARLESLGQWRSLRPTMPVLQWRVRKPW